MSDYHVTSSSRDSNLSYYSCPEKFHTTFQSTKVGEISPRKRYTSKLTFMTMLFCLPLLLASCGLGSSTELSGVVNIWHSWDEEEAVVLNQVLTRFTDINPDVTIRATVIGVDQLRARFEQSATAGLGPDLLLGPSDWIMPLADAGLIRRVDTSVAPDFWARYLPASVETVRYQEAIYGFPESLQLAGFYYNRELVEEPPTTLDGLIEEANQGRRVGLSPAFTDAFWGVQAFGGQLFDENERVVLNDGGFANWLSWLSTTLDIPNIVLDKDSQTLANLFVDGELVYLIAGSWLRKDLADQMGEDVLGVAALPSGPIDAAGPFLKTDAFMMSVASSARQVKVSAALSSFITNAEQQTLLMRQAGSIPTNIRMRNNSSIDRVAYTFRNQARDAVPLRNTPNMDAVLALSDAASNRALQGVAEPIVVAQELTREINTVNGFAPKIEVVNECNGSGTLSIWLGAEQLESTMLQSISNSFMQKCPEIKIAFSEFPMVEMTERLMTAVARNQPDVMMIPNRSVVPLVLADLLQPLNGFVDTQQLQAYHPSGVEALRANDQLYGIPFVLMPQALYVNQQLVSQPAQGLTDLITQGLEGKKLALSLSFVDAYWGVSAHGGKLFAENGQTILDEGGMTEWLMWLAQMQANGGLVVNTDIGELRARFAAGEFAYLVDGPQALAEMEEALSDGLLITRLPAGPVADAAPFLMATGLALKQEISAEQAQLALTFIEYATSEESQTMLADTTRLLPAAISATIDPTDPLTIFAEQAGVSVQYPNRTEMIAAEELGNRFYIELLDGNMYNGISGGIADAFDFDDAVQSIVTDINKANGFDTVSETDDASEE